MTLFSLAFLLGDWLLQQQSRLPSTIMLLLLILILSLFALIIKNNLIRMIALGLTLGFTYTTYYAHSILQERIPHDYEGKLLMIEGHILPQNRQPTLKKLGLILKGMLSLQTSWEIASFRRYKTLR